jgi:2-iminoacetate synthase
MRLHGNAKTVPVDDATIAAAVERHRHADAVRVREVPAKARLMNGLEGQDMAALMNVSDPELLGELFDTAQVIKNRIYGRRLVVFARLYVSNLCWNECTHCAFRARNTELERRALTQAEIARETRVRIDQGHKRVLLVAGESYPPRRVRSNAGSAGEGPGR